MGLFKKKPTYKVETLPPPPPSFKLLILFGEDVEAEVEDLNESDAILRLTPTPIGAPIIDIMKGRAHFQKISVVS